MARWLAELRRLPRWTGSTGSRVNLVLLVLLLGGYLPWRMGFEFLDALVLMPYAFTSLMFISVAAAEALAPEEIPSGECRGELRRRVWATAAGGLCYSGAILALGLVAVNLGTLPALVAPPFLTMISYAALSLAVAAFAAASAALMVAHHDTAADVRSRIRGILLLLLGVWLFRGWLIPVGLREQVAPWTTTARLGWLAAGGAVVLSLLAERRLRQAHARLWEMARDPET